MKISFQKYQGTANDFIMIDGRTHIPSFLVENPSLVQGLCHRRTGIGADGLIVLTYESETNLPKMIYYNSDGRLGSMCGNGGRAFVQFAKDLGMVTDQHFKFMASDGEHIATIEKNNDIALKMNDVAHWQIDTLGNYVLNTGSPHYVIFHDDDIHQLNVAQEGKKIRYNDIYKQEGINVNFVKIEKNDSLYVRTYERGVEDETYSCGTGVTASALSCYLKSEGKSGNSLDISTLGGGLKVRFDLIDHKFTNIWLVGPAAKSFEGVVEV
ncbi:MAG: diaminopimelate epimerase [Saprospiraceae bacterium]|nr:diaminopimelate epimerase [Saprospiraceae bacterium]